LPGGKAVVTPRGIRFKSLFYSCDLALKEGWFEKARALRNWAIDIAFDPRSVNEIFLRAPDCRSVETCRLAQAERRFLNKTWAEVDDFIKSQKIVVEASRTQDVQSTFNLQAQVGAIVGSANEKAAVANRGLTKAAKLRGVRENRRMEQGMMAQPTLTHSPNGESDPDTAVKNHQVAENGDSVQYIAPPSHLDLLRKQVDNQ